MVLRSLALALLGVLLSLPRPARADGEVWVWYDHHVRVLAPEGGPQLSMRAMTDLRANGRSGGLDMLFLRVGPILSVTPWLSLAAHFTTVADRTDAGAFSAQYRPEFDAVLSGRIGDFTISDRNRFEGILGVPDPLFRYRNMLRVDYSASQHVGVFAFDEILLRTRLEAFHENRATAGLRVRAGPDLTLDVGYMIRSRMASTSWEHDHIGLLSVVVLTDLVRPQRPSTETHGREAR